MNVIGVAWCVGAVIAAGLYMRLQMTAVVWVLAVVEVENYAGIFLRASCDCDTLAS